MTWKVDPAGVKSVLSSVATESLPMYSALNKVDPAVEGAVKGAQSQLIDSALNEFFSSIATSVTTIRNRVPAAMDGAAAATTAILHGDEQMAATVERDAASVGSSGASSAPGASSVFGAGPVAWAVPPMLGVSQ